jgi:uncharacterized repeat protein (TIGR03803 family)
MKYARLTAKLCSAVLCSAMFLSLPPMLAQTEQVLYTFGEDKGGWGPEAGLVADQSGALYGAASAGGLSFGQDGVIFKLTPPSGTTGNWKETVIYTFTDHNLNDGVGPNSNFVWDASGNLYGSTMVGGPQYCGTLFQLEPPTLSGAEWTQNTLVNLSCANFVGPGYVVRDPATGNLYGTILYGGQYNGGIVYQAVPPKSHGNWTYKVLHEFTCNPYAPDWVEGCGLSSLIMGPNGDLYGTTLGGGTDGGVVYKLSPQAEGLWQESVLYTFGASEAGPDGYSAYGLMMNQGALYGTTARGGSSGSGTVYRLNPPTEPGAPWSESILYNFAASGDGNTPTAGVTLGPNGVLYGTTQSGGIVESPCDTSSIPGCGTVFELTPQADGEWLETILHEFSPTDDAYLPNSGTLLLHNGYLFGMTTAAASQSFDYGAAYVVHP